MWAYCFRRYREDEDVLGMWVLLGAMALPPGNDGVCREGRRVVTGADTYIPALAIGS